MVWKLLNKKMRSAPLVIYQEVPNELRTHDFGRKC